MMDLAIKYLEKYALSQQTKEELIQKILELQKRDQEWFDRYDKLFQSKRASDKKQNEIEKRYETKIEEIITEKVRHQITAQEYKKIVDLKLGNTYNLNATWIDKIIFVLKTAERPLRSSEIIEVLYKNDRFFRTLTNHQKGLSAHLTKALKYGRIIGTKQKGQNGYLFSLPDVKNTKTD